MGIFPLDFKGKQLSLEPRINCYLCKTKLTFSLISLDIFHASKMETSVKPQRYGNCATMMQVDCKLFRRILIRQHKAQMKRKSKEIQEALVRHNCTRVIIGPHCVYVHDTGLIIGYTQS